MPYNIYATNRFARTTALASPVEDIESRIRHVPARRAGFGDLLRHRFQTLHLGAGGVTDKKAHSLAASDRFAWYTLGGLLHGVDIVV